MGGRGKVEIHASDGRSTYRLAHHSALTTTSAMAACKNKFKTKSLLKAAGVSTPKGVKVHPSISKHALSESLEGFRFPVVLKPADGKKGNGVITGVSDIDALFQALDNQSRLGDFLVEEQVEGEEYRVFVVGGKCLSVVQRVPAQLVGDGASSVRDLIKKYSYDRGGDVHLRVHPIKLDSALERALAAQELSLSSIPDAGRTFFLSYASNFSLGGRSIDCTDLVSSRAKSCAVHAVKATQGLAYAGVDIVVDSDGEPYVIELNHRPSIGSNHFPESGQGRDVAGAIIDQYFPRVRRSEHKLYPDLNSSKKLIKEASVVSVSHKVSCETMEELELSRVVIHGKAQGVRFENFVRRMALACNVNGSIESLPNGAGWEVFLAAKKQDLERFIKACRTGEGRSVVEGVDIFESSQVVFCGFVVK